MKQFEHLDAFYYKGRTIELHWKENNRWLVKLYQEPSKPEKWYNLPETYLRKIVGHRPISRGDLVIRLS